MYVCLGDLALTSASAQITFDRKKTWAKGVRDGIQQVMAYSKKDDRASSSSDKSKRIAWPDVMA